MDLVATEQREFMSHWGQLIDGNPTWRTGQSMFNALYHIRPDLADRLRGGELDPFYRDHNDGEAISNTLSWLEQHWEDPS